MANDKANIDQDRMGDLLSLLRNHGDLVLQAVADPICILDHHGYLLEASDAFLNLLEISRAELQGSHASFWDSRTSIRRDGETHFPDGKQQALFRRRDNSFVPVLAEYLCQEIGHEFFIHLSAHPFVHSEMDSEFLFEANAAALVILDESGRITRGNPSFWRMTGYEVSELSFLSFDLLYDPPALYRDFLELLRRVYSGKPLRSSIKIRRKDGSMLWLDITGNHTPIDNGRNGVLLVLLDTTELHLATEKMERRLTEDPLTGLPNRIGMEGAINGALARAKRKGSVFAVCALDLNDFKLINDRYGPSNGDIVLGEIAKRLRGEIRGSDFVARLGNDEFGLLIEDLSIEKTTSQLTHVLNRIQQTTDSLYTLTNGETIKVTLSMGIALFPSNGEDANTLVKQADAALYQAKSSKGGRSSQWWSFGTNLSIPSTSETSVDAYSPETREILKRHQAHIETVIIEFVEAFFAQIEQDMDQKKILGDQDEEELQTLASLQAHHLRFLLSPETSKIQILEQAHKIGRAHALIGVNGAMITQSMALYRRLLADHLNQTFLTARDRYRLILANEIRLQDDLQEELRSGIELTGEYLAALSSPLPPQGDLWADVRRGEVELLGRLPSISCVFLMRLNASGTFIIEESAGPKGQEGASIMRNPAYEAVVDPNSPQGKDLIAHAWRSLSIQRVSNYQKDPRVTHWRDIIRPLGIRSAVSIPIRNPEGTPVAVLSLYGTYPNQFESAWSNQFVRSLMQRWEKLLELYQAPASVISEDEATGYRRELFTGGLSMFMQPVFDLSTGRPVKVEALARLIRPNGNIITPGNFLPSLGDSELDRLFRSGLDEALSWIPRWDSQGLSLDVSLNLPPGTLRDPDCPKWIEAALLHHGVRPERLTLELLENREIDQKTQDEAIDRLIRLGIKLAMDDLGSGFSSLQRLATIPFDNIKVDQGLLTRIYVAPLHTLSMIGTIIRMGQDFERVVVVEGLEDLAMVEAATILGASFGQGYALARPMPADQILEWSKTLQKGFSPGTITTYLGALSFHRWGHSLPPNMPLPSLNQCPLTEFLSNVPNDNKSGIDSHAQFHKNGPGNSSARDLTEWLVDQIRVDHPPSLIGSH